ncbi:hypothetical protein QMK52_24270 [Pseudomonas sp. P9_2]|uniref:hypothetical protein n=1 Tax=Pseudomonas sp. P9_2 TaxID=3043447 RepID=UPI002A360A6E|nr:hypothetical protein [Pseudomonas sp. P9_2]WPN51992.1 hypothetical protein QMK52_24270 [Pseudomonas sp. P9_2]
MNETNAPDAENRISKQNPIVVAHQGSGQCYFRPETEELIFIADRDANDFEEHWRDMMTRVNEFHLAKEAYSRALEQYAKAASANPMRVAEDDPHAKEVAAAEAKLEKEREALRKKLGKFSQEGMSYDDVVELLPIGGQGAKRKNGVKPTRYAYVKKGYFTQSEEGRKLHKVSLKGSDQKGGKKSIYVKENGKRRRIDEKKLKEQLAEVKWPKVKLDMADIVQWTGLDFDPEALNKDFALFEWAESWNKSLVGQKALGANVDISGGAQFMRCISNVGASAEFDPNKGNVAVKGEAKASLTVASAVVNLAAYFPDRMGWSWSYTNTQGNTFDMGMVRLCLTPELSGFIGASAQVEAQLQVVTQGDQQVLAGQPDGRLPRFSERRTKGATFHKQMAAGDEGLSLSGEVFAGIRAEGSLKGSLQWLKPTPPADVDARFAGILKSSGDFTDFCTIGGNVAGLFGAGVGGKLHCTFINGRFCFHVAASLCWGAGAKGGFICEVGTKTIVEFGAWLIYQLYRLDYGFFDVVERSAFNVYSQYCIMKMADLEKDLYEAYGELKERAVDVSEAFELFLSRVATESKKDLESSKSRNQLARNIIFRRQDLLGYTPETKGVLLYLLTRHGVWDHLDLDNRGDGLIPDLYHERKEAVNWILKSIQTRAEWRKVFCRISPNGTNLASEESEVEIVQKQEQHLINFLREGINSDQGFHDAKRELMAVYNRLRTEVAWGYALAMNDTHYYKINHGSNFRYPQNCTFGPCEDQLEHWV